MISFDDFPLPHNHAPVLKTLLLKAALALLAGLVMTALL
jgi:hypothetical protein